MYPLPLSLCTEFYNLKDIVEYSKSVWPAEWVSEYTPIQHPHFRQGNIIMGTYSRDSRIDGVIELMMPHLPQMAKGEDHLKIIYH